MHVNILFTASFCIQGPCEEKNNPPSTFFVLGGGIIFPNQTFKEKIIIMSETRFLLDVFITYTLISLSFQKGSTTNLRLYFQNVLHRNPGFTCTCFKISSVSPFLNITAIFSFLFFFIFFPSLASLSFQAAIHVTSGRLLFTFSSPSSTGLGFHCIYMVYVTFLSPYLIQVPFLFLSSLYMAQTTFLSLLDFPHLLSPILILPINADLI